jgi:4-hydroxy-tetrahydrodipicolinate synthase
MEKLLVNKLGRVLVPLVTPFTEDFKVDYETYEVLINAVIERGYCDSLIITGSTGEFYVLSFEERLQLFETAIKAAEGRVPLIAGTGAASTAESIRLTKEAEKLGYDTAMVVAPYYSKPTQREIYQHFRSVAESVSLPILLYNIPLFTGVNIEPRTVGKLSEIDNILGIKEEAGIHPLQSTEIVLNTPDRFTVYSGDDTMVLQVLSQGGQGVVSGGSQVVGDLMKEQIRSYLEGEVGRATEIYLQLYPFFKALTPNDRVNPFPLLKAAITMTGIDVGPPRPPLLPATEEEKAHMQTVLRRLGKLEGGESLG